MLERLRDRRKGNACGSQACTGKARFLTWCAVWATIVACAPKPSPSENEATIRALIAAEAKGARTRDVALLESIWAVDGVVRDANHTPDDLADDQVWQGRDAIMLRYATVIFYLTLDEAGPVDLVMDIEGDSAVVTGTTRMGSELSPQGERWTFVRCDGKWEIAGITFNLEPGVP